MTEKRFQGGGGEMFGGTQAFRSPTLGPSTAQPGGEVTIGIVTLQLILLRISVNFVLKSLDSSISLSKVHPRLIPDICQFLGTTALFRPVKKSTKKCVNLTSGAQGHRNC